ncbi:MAG: helix-turn-helix domain-containing protein [Patescibacteria group bacterium]|mgnify:CR=1 FL=1
MLEKAIRYIGDIAPSGSKQKNFAERLKGYVDCLKEEGFEDPPPVENNDILPTPIAYSIAQGRFVYYPEDQCFDSVELDKSVRNVRLTRTENELFNLLVKNARRTVSKKTIVKRIWGVSDGTKNDLVKKYVQKLRGKLGSNTDTKRSIILSVHGLGYRLIVSVSPIYKTPTSISPQQQAAEIA